MAAAVAAFLSASAATLTAMAFSASRLADQRNLKPYVERSDAGDDPFATSPFGSAPFDATLRNAITSSSICSDVSVRG
jgi:hypothetical protein